MDSRKFAHETVSQIFSNPNNYGLDLIDIDSLFDEDTHDRPAISEDEAWELFS